MILGRSFYGNENCTQLEKATIFNKRITTFEFRNCSALETVIIKDRVKTPKQS